MAHATPTTNTTTLVVRDNDRTAILDSLAIPHGPTRIVMAALFLSSPVETVTALMRWAPPGTVPDRVRDELLRAINPGAYLAEVHQPRTEYAGDPSNPDEPTTYLVCVRCTELAGGDEVQWPCDTAVEAGLDQVTLTGSDAGFCERSPF